MSTPHPEEPPRLIDHVARERFRTEWQQNFAVNANAGSGKTTAISERLATMALSAEAAKILPRTAIVTYTRKAAQQIDQRARSVLLKKLAQDQTASLAPLDHLERAFFGTIHSFCILLAQRYAENTGINLNPSVIDADDSQYWEEFFEQDSMVFSTLSAPQLQAFLRHVRLDEIFPIARAIDSVTAEKLLARKPAGAPMLGSISGILAAKSPRKGATEEAVRRNQARAVEWLRRFNEDRDFLPLAVSDTTTAGMAALYEDFFAPLKTWLADAGAALAAELSKRYRSFRKERGLQTYGDQIEDIMTALRDPKILKEIRKAGWRVILDEAQDTDPHQFAVLVEITRPLEAIPDTWPPRADDTSPSIGPRPGHFCMVGDAQQAIYGSRADIRNFRRHVQAFERGDSGELLSFQVTFRSPHTVTRWLNRGFPLSFGPDKVHNLGLPIIPDKEDSAPLLQVPFQELEPGPANKAGLVSRLALMVPPEPPSGADDWLDEEARQIARFLKQHGPQAVGAKSWQEVCILAPRNEWLRRIGAIFEKEHLKVALQIRRNVNRDNQVYAWVTGLLAAICDPDNIFEWFGVLRELFHISDAQLVEEKRTHGSFHWEEPDVHSPALRDALLTLREFVMTVDDEGMPLGQFIEKLVLQCNLPGKARLLDPSGSLDGELQRLLAEAATLSLEGTGPREWLAKLLAEIDDTRPTGKTEDDAINLLSSHSAKGLEWPVVIAAGFWRRIGRPNEQGLRLVSNTGEGPRVFFDNGSLPSDLDEARKREHLRELVRLLYVTLTRAQTHLVIPWEVDFGSTARRMPGESFASLWGNDALLESLPVLDGTSLANLADELDGSVIEPKQQTEYPHIAFGEAGSADSIHANRLPALPLRLLPHQLAEKPDLVRSALHEATAEASYPLSVRSEEAIDYGLWWHSTLETWPWAATNQAIVEEHIAQALVIAGEKGFTVRGEAELRLFQSSDAAHQLNAQRWTREAELSVFAQWDSNAWIDGVIDLMMHDPATDEVWIVDWKTNRRLSGEPDDALLARLTEEYTPQLQAYGRCASSFFPVRPIRLFVYSTAAGKLTEIPRPSTK